VDEEEGGTDAGGITRILGNKSRGSIKVVMEEQQVQRKERDVMEQRGNGLVSRRGK